MSTHKTILCETCSLKPFEEFKHTCVHECMDLNKAMMETYKLGHWPRWDYQMEDATLVFSRDGKPQVICDMQVVGSTEGDTWEWSWGNAHLPEACRSRMCVVHELGEEKDWDRLTTLFLPNDENVGWECASIANHLLGDIGAYRCPDSDSKRDDNLVDAVYVAILSARFVD